ncbi:prolyl-tRNA synthetase associated domain-containing protein [Actinomyces bowdenii]|uniref:prolyl-tRNA synthetase associated domain-containing protein n=1 Tax=Actinomyces bowdenii TaxID=131109 RepID=UPI00214C7612|nr:prolyl-tRNA synthetase associated domain-containing protein [Actinomyces bowdenii]MCR2053524.1 prolyl-tRNA synthetase associated domain-containing protein [Actinomyces bowdenii]
MSARQDILDVLKDRGIDYELSEHEPVLTIEAMIEAGLPHPERIAKNLFVRDDKKRNYYLLVVPGEQAVDLRHIQGVIGSRRLSFASEADLAQRLAIAKGAVGPFAVLNNEARDVQLVIDEFFLGGLMGIHPNDNTATAWVGCEDVIALIAEHGNPVTTARLEKPEEPEVPGAAGQG